MFAKSFLLPAALLAAIVSVASAAGAKIETKDGGLEGTVEAVDDSTFKIMYTIEDASAPALYWWGSSSDDLNSGERISDEQVKDAAENKEVTIELADGKTTGDYAYIGLWCEQFKTSFGAAKLSETSGGDSEDSSAKDEDKDDMTNSGVKMGLSVSGALAAAVAVAGLMA